MKNTTLTGRTRVRRLPLVAAAAVLALTLAACGGSDGDDDTASDPAPSTSTETPAETPTEDPGATEATSEAPTEAAPGELPAWAPVIETEGDLVTGLDFSNTGDAPTELLSTTVVEGDGPPVEVGQTITANYFGSVYGSDEPFEESYSSQPFTAPIGVGQLIPGWDQKIPGVPVGSRIIMSIPPELAYGDVDRPGIPAGSTLVFVINIIDAA